MDSRTIGAIVRESHNPTKCHNVSLRLFESVIQLLFIPFFPFAFL